MIEKLILFLLLIFSAVSLSESDSAKIFIWNVGQGQWVTWQIGHQCLHFDMGGEYAPLKKIKKLCHDRENQLYLSHSDYDHIRYINWSVRNLKDFCLVQLPHDVYIRKKTAAFKNVALCADAIIKNNKHYVTEIALGHKSMRPSMLPSMKPNDLSRIFILKSRFGNMLIPGDSTRRAEKLWAQAIYQYDVHYIVLGHHGSVTSTSHYLLNQMPNLKSAFVSARKKRYGHPHRTTIESLLKYHTPLLKTEAWGDLSFKF